MTDRDTLTSYSTPNNSFTLSSVGRTVTADYSSQDDDDIDGKSSTISHQSNGRSTIISHQSHQSYQSNGRNSIRSAKGSTTSAKKTAAATVETVNSDSEDNTVGISTVGDDFGQKRSPSPSTVCSSAEMIYSTDGMTIKQLPWTEADTKEVMAQITFMQEELLGGRGAVNENILLWKEGLDELKHKLKETMAENGSNSLSGKQGVLSRSDPLLKKVTSTMRGINLVDIPKLIKLMKSSQDAGDCLEGKDVILLCGETGAGKTTTMQFLVGTTFEEVEADGFVHLNPTSYVFEEHKKFKTSYSREPTTRCLQAATVYVNEVDEIAIADVPSSDVANCLEEDIALGMGMVQAVQRAKSVRPVVVLSREGMGNRFSNLPEAMRVVSRLCNVNSKEDWTPFGYVFTKYEEKHRRLIHKQFAALQRNPPRLGRGQDQALFEAFIEDIADKTNPDAHVILPMEGHPANILSSLYDSPVAMASPQDLCAAFASDFSLKQMKLQMEVQLHNFRGNLLQEEYSEAIKGIKHMIDMSGMFPDMQSYIHQAKEAFLQQVAQVWVLVVRSIGKQDYHTALYRMEQLSTIAKDFPDAVECLELGHEMLSQSITEPITEQMYDKSIERMISLSALEARFKEASNAVNLGLQTLRETLETLVEVKNFTAAIGLIKLLGSAESNICTAFDVAQHGLHLVREKLQQMIEGESYTEGIELTMLVSDLGKDFAEANVYVRRILKTMRKRIDQTVQCGDYVKAGYLLKSLFGLGAKLFDGAEYVEFAFDAAAQHVCELRMEVVNAFEALLKVKDDRKYEQLLDYALTAEENLLKSEPMRLVCADFYKTKEREMNSDNFKPNYLVILCTPKDCSSEAFCVAQVRHLVETVSAELNGLETENTSMEYLMGHRKSLLSVILRLRATAQVFKDGPGGSMAATTYDREFGKFQALITSILALSEASFDSSMEMKQFEFQAWFLAFLIQGFIKDIPGNEKGGDVQVMQDLDHRRVTLMLRFENEISDTMELLSTYNFPDLKVGAKPIDFHSFFQELKLVDLEAPRQLLLSLGQAPNLCKMMVSMVSAKQAKKSVAALDKALVELFIDIVKYLEDAYGNVTYKLKAGQISRKTAVNIANRLSRDVGTVRPEAEAIKGWSNVTSAGIPPRLMRLAEIEYTLKLLIRKLDDRSIISDDISPAAFFMSIFAEASVHDGPLGCSSCFGRSSTEEDFLANLPKLSDPSESGGIPGLLSKVSGILLSTSSSIGTSKSQDEGSKSSSSNKSGGKDPDTARASSPSRSDAARAPTPSARAPTPASIYKGYNSDSSRAPTPASSQNRVSFSPTPPTDLEDGTNTKLRRPVDC